MHYPQEEIKMTEKKYAAVKFGWQRDDDHKTYDYEVPEGLELVKGDIAYAATKSGETKVYVKEIKDHSDLATKVLLRKAEPEAPAEAE